ETFGAPDPPSPGAEEPAAELAVGPEPEPEPWADALEELAPEPQPARRRAAATPARGSEPDIPLRPRSPDGAPNPPKRQGGFDIDLSDALAELTGMSSAPTPKAKPAPSASLDDAFQDFRSEVSRQSGSHEAGEHLTLAKTYLEMGMAD